MPTIPGRPSAPCPSAPIGGIIRWKRRSAHGPSKRLPETTLAQRFANGRCDTRRRSRDGSRHTCPPQPSPPTCRNASCGSPRTPRRESAPPWASWAAWSLPSCPLRRAAGSALLLFVKTFDKPHLYEGLTGNIVPSGLGIQTSYHFSTHVDINPATPFLTLSAYAHDGIVQIAILQHIPIFFKHEVKLFSRYVLHSSAHKHTSHTKRPGMVEGDNHSQSFVQSRCCNLPNGFLIG